MQQLFPERAASQIQPINKFDNSPQAHQYEENVKQMCNLIASNGLFPNNLENNRDLLNIFTSQQANHEQTNDMLSFYQIGETAYQNYVRYHILQTSSVKVPVRHHKLITMATTKPNKTRSTHKERETKQVITCLRWCLAWVSHNQRSYTRIEEQYSELPRALCM